MKNKRKNLIFSTIGLILLYLLLLVTKFLDIYFITNDKSKVGVNYIYLSVSLLILYLFSKTYKNEKIGFPQNKMYIALKGVLFSFVFLCISVLIESLYLSFKGLNPKLIYYPSIFLLKGYGMTNSIYTQIILIIIFAIILVVVEEGLFRGAILYNFEKNFNFNVGLIISTIFYLIWALVPSFVIYINNLEHKNDLIEEVVILLFISILLSLKWSMEKKLTNSLWFSTGDHIIFTILFILFKVDSSSLVNEGLNIRLFSFAILSFLAILIIYINREKSAKIIEYLS